MPRRRPPADPPRLTLFDRPTPVREVPELGVWVKDDASIGGNKVRKLEYTLADARARGKRTVLTFGGLGSHHALATARECDRLGLRCVLALVDQPAGEHVEAMQAAIARTGAVVHRTRTPRRTAALVPWLLVRHRLPYVLPVGGSSRLGVRGFVAAANELAGQVRAGELPEPASVVVAIGSGGTAAGLAAGLPEAGLRPRLVGVLVNDLTRVDADRMARRAGPDPLPVEVHREFLGAGYGHATPEGEEALDAAARAGLVLDPVYTAKALAAAGALDLPEPVLFWNTYAPG